MKILLITPFYSPVTSGSSRLLQDVTQALIADGHTVEVLTYAADLARCREFDAAQSYPIHRILPQRLPGGSSCVMMTQFLSLTRRRQFDLVLCGVAFPVAILAYAARFLTRVPYAVYSFGEDVTMVQGARLKTALLAKTLQSACAVVTISRFTRREVEKLGAPPDKVFCIAPGIDSDRYEQVPREAVEALRGRLGIPKRPLLLTVARLSARKGHDMIIRALPDLGRQVPDLHYLIVGYGDSADLRALAAAGGVSDRVTFVDYVSDADLPALYQLCDVYAMVSRWDAETKQVEGFGIVYLEASACGKPCVAGSSGGSPDAVENGVTGFVVDPTSQSEITEALRALLTDESRALSLGAAGQARVREHFQKDQLLSQVTQVLSRAVSGKNALPEPGS